MELTCRKIIFLKICLVLFPSFSVSHLVDNNPYRHIEILDKDGKFQLEWLADYDESRVIFNVTVKTKGYIGLGLSRKGKMSGADMIIGGVLPNGQPYFSDRHAIANQLPVEDGSQDWVLHSAWESSTHTFLSFSRPFETCDEDHDLPIHGDVIGLLWAFGEKDNDIEYHHQNRGVFYTYLLDPDLTPRELEKSKKSGLGRGKSALGDWKVWSITGSHDLNAQDTTYVCSIHKAQQNRKHHIVGFRSILPSEVDQRHIHHFLLHRCIPPEGQDASKVFENLLDHKEECYILSEPAGRIPTHYCREVVHVWAVGGKPIFFPDHVGIPMYPNEYYMLQMHFDNPDIITGVQLNYMLEIFHTENLRENDAGVLSIGELTPGSTSIMVPPNSLAHRIYGHCGSGCTQSMIPRTGIRAFAANLHTHLAGRGVRLLHIRNKKELPWISYDDNYSFDYQQDRILREERLILPGDDLIIRCIYENTDRNGNVTIGGFSTRNEMCTGFIWYYDKIVDRAICRSEIRADVYGNFLQIYNTTWSNERREHVVTSPSPNTGLLVSEVGNRRIDWTISNREQIQNYHRYLPQISSCPSLLISEDEFLAQRKSPWLSATPQVPQRYPPISSIRRIPSLSPSSPSKLTRPIISQNDYLGSTPGKPSESRNSDLEFISIYPKDISPYQRPNVCLHPGARK